MQDAALLSYKTRQDKLALHTFKCKNGARKQYDAWVVFFVLRGRLEILQQLKCFEVFVIVNIITKTFTAKATNFRRTTHQFSILLTEACKLLLGGAQCV